MAIDKIGSAAITDCTVVAADIAPGTVTNAKLAGSIANAKLANSSVTINGTSISLGASGSIPAVQWQSVVTSDGSTVTTMVAGRGYFVNNTSAAGLVKLPLSASAGDTVAIKDYAGNFGTNNLTIQRNGHKIQGAANDSLISTNRASLTLVYVDATKGWLYANESNVADLEFKTYISATGGTVTTIGDFKVHAFTGDGCFVVSQVGNPAGSSSLSNVLVVAGGGGGGRADVGAGGGAGGLRNLSCVSVTAQTYPITVGGGGATQPSLGQGNNGSPSVFSTFTSTGGGGGGGSAPPYGPEPGNSGGSGGGGANACGAGGSGNTPPVSPPQGNDGATGAGTTPQQPIVGGGGGGASAAAVPVPTTPPSPGVGGNGGAGLDVSPFFGTAPQPFYQANATCRGATACGQFAGGGGGAGDGPGGASGGAGGVGGGGKGSSPGNNSGYAGTTNSGGGGGGGENTRNDGGAGGKGIVLIKYKFQN